MNELGLSQPSSVLICKGLSRELVAEMQWWDLSESGTLKHCRLGTYPTAVPRAFLSMLGGRMGIVVRVHVQGEQDKDKERCKQSHVGWSRRWGRWEGWNLGLFLPPIPLALLCTAVTALGNYFKPEKWVRVKDKDPGNPHVEWTRCHPGGVSMFCVTLAVSNQSIRYIHRNAKT